MRKRYTDLNTNRKETGNNPKTKSMSFILHEFNVFNKHNITVLIERHYQFREVHNKP